MRRIVSLALVGSFVGFTGLASGCAYTGLESYNGNLYVARTGLFLGVGRNIYQCQPDGAGNIACVAMEGRP